MAIITITRGSYHYGTDLAKALAEKLGFPCISRESLRREAAERFGVPHDEFVRDVENPPWFLGRISGGKAEYVAFLRAAFLKQVGHDNVVYHGYMGQFFLQGIPHVLKVLITANEDLRVKELLRREPNMPRAAAEDLLQKVDARREEWCRHVYGVNPWQSTLHDLAYHIDQLSTEVVVDSLAEMARLPCFALSSDARQMLADRCLAADIEARLVQAVPEPTGIRVAVSNGTVTLSGTVASAKTRELLLKEIEDREGVWKLELEQEVRPPEERA